MNVSDRYSSDPLYKGLTLSSMTTSHNIIELEESIFFSKLKDTTEKWIVDVRKREDFNEFHLPKALNIDIMSPNAIDGISHLRREKSLFLYCNSGIRCKSACSIFEKMGFKNIYHLTKGINSCSKSSLELC